MQIFKRICTKCGQEFETIQKKETPLCHLCQHDVDLNERWDMMEDEIEREERYREQDGLDAPYE